MLALDAVTVLPAAGVDTPVLRIYRLPKRKEARSPELWAEASAVRVEPGVAVFEVAEGCEYRFEWSLLPDEHPSITEPQELFEPDDETGRTGRLRPRLSTGTIDASLLVAGLPAFDFSFEVRSRKLDYKSEYRWMLRDVAEHMTELVMQRFSASRMGFEVDERRAAATLYEQFEFLRAALQGDRMRQAFARIVLAPHMNWEVASERAPASRGLRATAASLKQIGRGGGRRIPIAHIEGLASVPDQIMTVRTEQTLDTVPNRFVRYALEHWQGLLWRLADALAKKESSAIVHRGRREARVALDDLSEILDSPLLRDVGRLDQFPSGNQVLQKREGYRDFYRIFIEMELAAMLTWHKPEEAYRAGQRDVAQLYEFWAFLQIGSIVGNLIGKRFLLAPLLTTSPDGLAINLRSGEESVLEGDVVRSGRCLRIALHFNRTFDASSPGGASWTRPMRPDITLSITRRDTLPFDSEPTHIHFDAKYRIQALEEIFGKTKEVVATGAETAADSPASTVRRDDLLKMHAYRDAIRRTAGAYVLYPGTGSHSEEFREYHELLPGLGAFVLRPTQDGVASGTHAVRAFIDGVLNQSALRFTKYERSRLWMSEVYGPDRTDASYLEPPAQASVLLGYVKSREHWSWIHRTRTYNIRTLPRAGGVTRDSALLQSQLLLLYCPDGGELEVVRIVGEAELVPADAMASSGYPQPQGDYWCVQISLLGHGHWTQGLAAETLDEFVLNRTGTRGAPALTDWGTVSLLRSPTA